MREGGSKREEEKMKEGKREEEKEGEGKKESEGRKDPLLDRDLVMVTHVLLILSTNLQ